MGGTAAPFRLPEVRTALTCTFLIIFGYFAGYTYLTPYLMLAFRLLSSSVPSLLLAYGVAGLVGTSAVEQSVRVDSALGWHMGHDPDLFTAAGVFSVRVASVGDDVQRRRSPERLRRGLSHRQHAAVAGCIERDACVTIRACSASTAVCTL